MIWGGDQHDMGICDFCNFPRSAFLCVCMCVCLSSIVVSFAGLWSCDKL